MVAGFLGNRAPGTQRRIERSKERERREKEKKYSLITSIVQCYRTKFLNVKVE
jgi:hypothetical protein